MMTRLDKWNHSGCLRLLPPSMCLNISSRRNCCMIFPGTEERGCSSLDLPFLSFLGKSCFPFSSHWALYMTTTTFQVQWTVAWQNYHPVSPGSWYIPSSPLTCGYQRWSEPGKELQNRLSSAQCHIPSCWTAAAARYPEAQYFCHSLETALQLPFLPPLLSLPHRDRQKAEIKGWGKNNLLNSTMR